MFVRRITSVSVADVVANFKWDHRIACVLYVCAYAGFAEVFLCTAISYVVDLLIWNRDGSFIRKCKLVHACTVYTLLVEKTGVAPDVTLGFIARKQVSVQVREPPWLWSPWRGSHEVQNRAISGPTKWTLVQQKIFKKRSKLYVSKPTKLGTW